MKSCKNCGHTDEKTNCTSDFLEPEDPKDFCANWIEWKKITNGDRVRAMSDEDLAEVMMGGCGVCAYANDEIACSNDGCRAGAIAWLKQEAPNA